MLNARCNWNGFFCCLLQMERFQSTIFFHSNERTVGEKIYQQGWSKFFTCGYGRVWSCKFISRSHSFFHTHWTIKWILYSFIVSFTEWQDKNLIEDISFVHRHSVNENKHDSQLYSSIQSMNASFLFDLLPFSNKQIPIYDVLFPIRTIKHANIRAPHVCTGNGFLSNVYIFFRLNHFFSLSQIHIYVYFIFTRCGELHILACEWTNLDVHSSLYCLLNIYL